MSAYDDTATPLRLKCAETNMGYMVRNYLNQCCMPAQVVASPACLLAPGQHRFKYMPADTSILVVEVSQDIE